MKRRPHRVEAYGLRGLQNRPWRRTFESVEAMAAWAEAHDATVLGTRERDPEEIAAEGR